MNLEGKRKQKTLNKRRGLMTFHVCAYVRTQVARAETLCKEYICIINSFNVSSSSLSDYFQKSQ